MSYKNGESVVVRNRDDIPGGFAWAGAKAAVRPRFSEMSFYSGMESFLCLEITEASDPEKVGRTIFLHESQVAPAE